MKTPLIKDGKRKKHRVRNTSIDSKLNTEIFTIPEAATNPNNKKQNTKSMIQDDYMTINADNLIINISQNIQNGNNNVNNISTTQRDIPKDRNKETPSKNVRFTFNDDRQFTEHDSRNIKTAGDPNASFQSDLNENSVESKNNN